MTWLLLLLSAAAFNTQAADTLTAQQQQLKQCNAQANRNRLLSEARQDFMAKCMRSHGDGPPRFTAQYSRMAGCSRQASDAGVSEAQRQDFINECLKDSTAAAGGRR